MRGPGREGEREGGRTRFATCAERLTRTSEPGHDERVVFPKGILLLFLTVRTAYRTQWGLTYA